MHLNSQHGGPNEEFGKPAASVGVQSILFNNELEHVERSIAALARAAELAIFEGVCSRVRLQYGDCSPQRCISAEELEVLQRRYNELLTIDYCFFGNNLGSARGHNELSRHNDCEFFLVKNPDVIVSPRLLEVMISVFWSAGVGMVEAKQLPIEHPKEYNKDTGETSWATTACAMIPAPLFTELGGFDAESFFLYCDDVDFSWQVRRAGFRVVYMPSAVVFHDKRLGNDGAWQPSSAEKYYSAEAALLLTYKWSRSDLTNCYLEYFNNSGVDYLMDAAAEFCKRKANGQLPEQIDTDHRVGQFVGDYYAKHRFSL